MKPEDEPGAALLKTATEEQFRQSVIWARNGGYRDGYAGAKANPPAWDTVADWSNAYAEGYKLGAEARRKIKPHAAAMQDLF